VRKIVAGLCVYREADGIKYTLDSIHPFVDQIIVLDGPFTNFPDMPDDGTRQISERYDNVRYITTARMSETKKRSMFFDLIDHGDFLLIIDGDEVLQGAPEDIVGSFGRVRVSFHTRVFWIPMTARSANWPGQEFNLGPRPRLIRVEKGMHYANHHRVILNDDGSVLTNTDYVRRPDFEILPEIRIHNADTRTSERRKNHQEYGKLMAKRAWREEDD